MDILHKHFVVVVIVTWTEGFPKLRLSGCMLVKMHKLLWWWANG